MNSSSPLYDRGVELSRAGRFDTALGCFDQALADDPGNVAAHYNRAVTLFTLKRLPEALASYDAALALKPDFVNALCNRGVILAEMKRFDQALASYDAALTFAPDLALVLANRGNTLRHLKRFEEALASYERALTLRPDHAEAWVNRGLAYTDLARFDQALRCFDEALAIAPDHASALYFRADLLWSKLKRYAAAVQTLERLVTVAPEHPYARGDLLHLRMHACDWRDFDREVARVADGVRAGKRIVRPFIAEAVSGSPADLRACAEIFASDEFPALPAVALSASEHHTARDIPDQIKVGYVSGEFGEQATAYLTAGLYEAHDRTKFEIVAFDNGGSDGSSDGSRMRKRLEAAFDGFIDISRLDDAAAARRISAEGIDILVNLNGYFGKARMGVFAHRPTPIQVNYLGFPGTLGAGYMDYILADRVVIPEDERHHYIESVVYLPDSYQVNDDKREIAEAVPSRRACGLPEEGFVFCNFNQTYKLTPSMFAAWMRILRGAPGSVLWLLDSSAPAAENLRREAQAQGVAGDRLVFAPHIALDRHLARLSHADLVLDSLPYNAHTTASDALWAGVPLLTCRGTTFPGRVAASLLAAAGLPELITETLPAYEQFALALAHDPARVQSLRDTAVQNRSGCALFDTGRVARAIETAYATMVDRCRRGQPPAGFAV